MVNAVAASRQRCGGKMRAQAASPASGPRDRLRRVPEQLPQIIEGLKRVQESYGVTPAGSSLFRLGEDIDAVIDNQAIHPKAIAVLFGLMMN